MLRRAAAHDSLVKQMDEINQAYDKVVKDAWREYDADDSTEGGVDYSDAIVGESYRRGLEQGHFDAAINNMGPCSGCGKHLTTLGHALDCEVAGRAEGGRVDGIAY
jgi:hypothetical protein